MRIAREAGYVSANQRLLTLDKRLKLHDFNLTCDQAQLKTFAEGLVKRFVLATAQQTDADALCAGRRLAALYGIEAPHPDQHQGLITPILNRLSDPNWWRRKLQAIQKRRIDEVARDFQTVHQQSSPYVSGWGLSFRRHQKELGQEYLETTTITNDAGEQLTLKEVADRTIANPRLRRAELMTRVKGFELVAQELGHVAEFYTITTPSKMHAQGKTGKRNPKYEGTTPGEAQTYLNHLWQCARARLHREGIYVYGFRVVEPHHDGTPHWHLLLFMEPRHQEQTRLILQDYSLKEDGHEPGASKQRFKAIAIDPAKGSATGYIAKYIAKNIDGAHLDSDLYGNEAAKSAERIEAWASIHGIRQFQQIGGPSVTTWRELRRLNPENAEPLKEFFTPADAGDWAAYVRVMGGPNLRRCDRPVQPFYHQHQEALPSGELNPDALTKYGDLRAPTIRGLECGGIRVPTRLRKWQILTMKPARQGCDWVRAQPAPSYNLASG